MSKEIWIPTTVTKVKIDIYGNLTTWQEMEMKLKPVKEKTLGFGEKNDRGS